MGNLSSGNINGAIDGISNIQLPKFRPPTERNIQDMITKVLPPELASLTKDPRSLTEGLSVALTNPEKALEDSNIFGSLFSNLRDTGSSLQSTFSDPNFIQDTLSSVFKDPEKAMEGIGSKLSDVQLPDLDKIGTELQSTLGDPKFLSNMISDPSQLRSSLEGVVGNLSSEFESIGSSLKSSLGDPKFIANTLSTAIGDPSQLAQNIRTKLPDFQVPNMESFGLDGLNLPGEVNQVFDTQNLEGLLSSVIEELRSIKGNTGMSNDLLGSIDSKEFGVDTTVRSALSKLGDMKKPNRPQHTQYNNTRSVKQMISG